MSLENRMVVDWQWDEKDCEDHCPQCEFCGEYIQDEYLYDLDGDIYCEECMKERFRKPSEKYMRG